MTYPLANANRRALDRMRALDQMLNDATITHLKAAGLKSGHRCWDVGGGTGELARRMAEVVGPIGKVTVSDLDTRYMAGLPKHIEVVGDHDVAAHKPPGGPYDLVHARLVLAHLPDRTKALANMAGVLRPGGMVVVQDWGAIGASILLDSEYEAEAPALYERFQEALARVFESHGNDRGWVTQTLSAMRDLGLVDVRTEQYARSWEGDSPGAHIQLAVADELRPDLIAAGFPEKDIERIKEILIDPCTEITGHLTWITLGHRGRQ